MIVICRDGRLHENDHLLAVDGHLLGEKSSLEDAVYWLQAATGKVTLVVAHETDSPRQLSYNSLTPTASQLPAGEVTVSHRFCFGFVGLNEANKFTFVNNMIRYQAGMI